MATQRVALSCGFSRQSAARTYRGGKSRVDPQLYATQARQALASAQRLAEERRHHQLEPERLFFTLMGQ